MTDFDLSFAMTAFVQTVYPGYVPRDYFEDENVTFVQKRIRDILLADFTTPVQITKADIVRIMQRVLEERPESIPKMNQRTIMYITNEVRNHQIDVNKHLKWEENYVYSQRLYDPVGKRGPDMGMIKLSNRLGKPRVGGTVRFYFT